jgi:hypothetical protein
VSGQSSFILSAAGSGSCGPFIIQIKQNVATFDAYGECLQASILRIYAVPGAYIELPKMPRTTESLSCQAALAQPAFLMGTRVNIRMDVVVNIDQQYAVAAYVKAHHFAAPKVV